MKKCFFLLLLFLLSATCAFAQQVITGTITDETNEPLIGVSVTVKGTTTGVITNFEGQYSITVPTSGVLSFSFVGMKQQTFNITPDMKKLDVVMISNDVIITEVVVTAMGVKTEKKKLNFAVQSVSGDDLNESRSPNFVNSLQGKVAGINVTTAGGSPNAGSSVIIRAISSINTQQSNQPLYILDGMAISGGTADINPNDIESITVLKGAAASALYGQDAANGVIMITTKQGNADKLTINASGGWQVDQPTRLPKVQTLYGPGALGFFRPEEDKGNGGWGPPFEPGTPIYDNINNYFQTGLYQKYDFSINGGSEKAQVYASVGYSRHEGVVVNDYLNKLTMLLKANFKINDRLSMNASINTVNNTYRGAGTLSSAYLWPVNDDIRNYENEDGTPRFRYFPIGDEHVKKNAPVSPLWSRYKDWGENVSNRKVVQASIIYEPVKKLTFTGRASYDTNNYIYDGYTVPRFDILTQDILPDFAPSSAELTPEEIAAEKDAYYAYYNSNNQLNQSDLANIRSNKEDRGNLLGTYTGNTSFSQMLTLTGLVNYSVDLSDNFTLEAMVGAEAKIRKGFSTSSTGREFTAPGVYSMQITEANTPGLRDLTVEHNRRRIAGAFGEIRLDYRSLLSLSATFRMDWSSTLRYENSPYTYPSITSGVLFSELFDLTNDVFSYGKVRGNWARVGKDAPALLFDRRYMTYPTLPDGGYGINPGLSVASNDLTPEFSDSWEIGLDVRFFDNKTRLDVAFYNTAGYNQIVTVRVSPASGYILQTRNEGDISNRGIEATLEQDIFKTRDFSWTAGLNFGLNRGKVIGLPADIGDELPGTQYGDVFTTAFLHGSTTAISGKDYLRTDDGQIIVNESGYPKIVPQKSVVIGNREPDFLLGLTSRLNYKGVSLSFLIDGRKGGDVFNYTARSMMGSGQHKLIENYRGRQVVWEGVVEQPDGTYLPNTTPIVMDYQTISTSYNGVSSNFIEDGSYIRLSYMTLGYDFSSKILKKGSAVKSLKGSLTGNNLFLLTKYTGSDPQINASTSGSAGNGTGSSGIDNFAVPTTRSFNFTVSATF